MNNRKLFTVYLQNEIGDVDLNVHIDLNLGKIIPEDKTSKMLTKSELNQLQHIALNICKRANKVNGVNELKALDILIE